MIVKILPPQFILFVAEIDGLEDAGGLLAGFLDAAEGGADEFLRGRRGLNGGEPGGWVGVRGILEEAGGVGVDALGGVGEAAHFCWWAGGLELWCWIGTAMGGVIAALGLNVVEYG